MSKFKGKNEGVIAFKLYYSYKNLKPKRQIKAEARKKLRLKYLGLIYSLVFSSIQFMYKNPNYAKEYYEKHKAKINLQFAIWRQGKITKLLAPVENKSENFCNWIEMKLKLKNDLRRFKVFEGRTYSKTKNVEYYYDDYFGFPYNI